MERAAGKLMAAFLPRTLEFGGRRAIQQYLVESAVKWPGIIDIECFQEQLGLAGLRQHHDIGLHFCEFRPSVFPERRRHHGSHVASKAVEVESARVNPM